MNRLLVVFLVAIYSDPANFVQSDPIASSFYP